MTADALDVDALIARCGPQHQECDPMTCDWAALFAALRAQASEIARLSVAPPLREPPAEYLRACWERHNVHQPVTHALWLTMREIVFKDAAVSTPATDKPK